VVEVTTEEAASSPVEPCRLGIVLKGRDVFEARQAGIHLVDEQSVTTWDRMRRTRGLDAIKKRLICDATGKYLYLGLHVDDSLIIYSNDDQLNHLYQYPNADTFRLLSLNHLESVRKLIE
jgi:hypothetical protein